MSNIKRFPQMGHVWTCTQIYIYCTGFTNVTDFKYQSSKDIALKHFEYVSLEARNKKWADSGQHF